MLISDGTMFRWQKTCLEKDLPMIAFSGHELFEGGLVVIWVGISVD